MLVTVSEEKKNWPPQEAQGGGKRARVEGGKILRKRKEEGDDV
jgi:hypothetical protein